MQVSADEFRQLFDRVSNWGRWGADDERGALNYLTPALVAAAAGLARTGRTVSLSRSLNTEREPDNPEPADHRMTMLGGREHPEGLAFAKDYIGVDYHNDSHSHLDALCHVSYDDSLYNGLPADSVSATGATVETVEALKDGLVGRGVLLDVPRTRGVSWLEPGDSVLPGDLSESERPPGGEGGGGRHPAGPDRARDRASTSWGPGTPPARRRACTRPARSSCPSGGSPLLAVTGTATRPRASPRASAFRSTCSR